MTTDKAREIAAGLSPAQRAAVTNARQTWFAASDIHAHNSAGMVLTRLSEQGLFERRSDPSTWGRGQYKLTAVGLAVRAVLMEGEGA